MKGTCPQPATYLNHTAENTEADDVNLCAPVGFATQTPLYDGMGPRPSRKQKETERKAVNRDSNGLWRRVGGR